MVGREDNTKKELKGHKTAQLKYRHSSSVAAAAVVAAVAASAAVAAVAAMAAATRM